MYGKSVEISTCHITSKDNDELEAMVENAWETKDTPHLQEPLYMGRVEDGFVFIITQSEHYFNRSKDDCKEKGYELSDSFWAAMKFAHGKKCRFLSITSEGDCYEELDQHDW